MKSIAILGAALLVLVGNAFGNSVGSVSEPLADGSGLGAPAKAVLETNPGVTFNEAGAVGTLSGMNTTRPRASTFVPADVALVFSFIGTLAALAPEPASLLVLLCAGIAGMYFFWRARRRRATIRLATALPAFSATHPAVSYLSRR